MKLTDIKLDSVVYYSQELDHKVSVIGFAHSDGSYLIIVKVGEDGDYEEFGRFYGTTADDLTEVTSAKLRNTDPAYVPETKPEEPGIGWRNPNPWRPMRAPIDVKYIGKLGEETHELGQVVMRCLLQGINETHPETGKINKTWLEDEMGDVLGHIRGTMIHFKLDGARIAARARMKEALQAAWAKML